MIRHEELAKRLSREVYNDEVSNLYNLYQDGEDEEIKKYYGHFTKETYINSMVQDVLTNQRYPEVKYAGKEFITRYITNLANKDGDFTELSNFLNW